MKRTITPLLALGLLSTHAFAETSSFRDAIENGKVSGEIRNAAAFASYTDAIKEAGPFNNSKSGVSVLELKYQTDSYRGFTFGTVFQAGWDWGIQDESTGLTIAGGEDDHRLTVSTVNLQNAYVDYSFAAQGSKTNVRVGRQDIISPLLMRSGLQPVKDAFEGVVISNSDIDKTVLKVMYINKWLMRYGDDASDSVTQNDINYEHPLVSLYVNSKAIEGLNIEAQWLSNDNTGPVGDPPTAVPASGPYSTTFFAADYAIPGTDVAVGAKYMGAAFDNSADTSLWGVKAATNLGPVRVTLSYTTVDDDANLPGTLGHVPLFRAYTNTITDTEFYAGVDSVSLNLGYDFGVKGLAANLNYTQLSQSAAGIENGGFNFDDSYEISADIKYKVQSVEGLSMRLNVANAGYNDAVYEDADLMYTRVFVNYAF